MKNLEAAIREFVAAEIQVAQHEIRGAPRLAEVARARSTMFDTAMREQLEALDARLKALEDFKASFTSCALTVGPDHAFGVTVVGTAGVKMRPGG